MNIPAHPVWSLRPWQRHSLVLAVAGVVYICVGLAYILTPATDTRTESLTLVLNAAPLDVWGVVWMLVGFLSLLSTRWPQSSKTWGYSALTALAAAWGSAYLLGALLLDTPASAITGGFVWLLVAFLWWAIAGLMNADDATVG